jgi:hypothetical protein
MPEYDGVQLAGLVNPGDPVAVLEECYALWAARYGERSFSAVLSAFDQVRGVFAGLRPGYHACDTDYHNFEHTLAVLLASSRLLDGAFEEGAGFEAGMAEDYLIAALCHDTGYIRRVGEEGGTGARFTFNHVERSAHFIRDNAHALGLARPERIKRLIWSTGLRDEFNEQAWDSKEERLAGAMLASADLIGQMSDRAYLEKLLFLYYEFREAGFPGYDTEFDILRKTLGFYDATVARLDGALGGVRSYARGHFKSRYGLDRDLYAEAMERQMEYLKSIIADDSTNFRKKLKRLDLERAV